jgi:murein DD-endopeptidase MepM/ murein hydrolase activator NlpD
MKRIYSACSLLISSLAFAQNHSTGIVIGHDHVNTQCISDSQRTEIKQHIAENIALLKSQGRLPQNYSTQQVLFDWPLRLRTGLVDYGYHSISAQVDHNPNYPNQVLDYNCGSRTYDNSGGYNHQGTDYFLWPFDWNKMDSGDVEIVAVAPGTIVYKSDGQFDRSCGFNSNNWNAVYVQHADGSVAWYGHMKSGSLTTKNVGQTVTAGEYLGSVGSSGNSTGPHLHLEIYDANNVLQDPYQGSCNNFNSNSWWNSQRPYLDKAINHIATNFDPPIFPACSNEATKNERDYFTNTDTIFLFTYYRFLMLNDSVRINIYRPNNSLWGTWSWTNGSANFNAAYVYFWMIAGSAEPNGQWRFEAVYENQVYFHNFWLGPTGVPQEMVKSEVSLYPNPNSGEFTLLLNGTDLSQEVTFELRDVLGREVVQQPVTAAQTSISKQGLSPGVYTYSVRNAGGQVGFGKVVIN